jgi:hypothetical protein
VARVSSVFGGVIHQTHQKAHSTVSSITILASLIGLSRGRMPVGSVGEGLECSARRSTKTGRARGIRKEKESYISNA